MVERGELSHMMDEAVEVTERLASGAQAAHGCQSRYVSPEPPQSEPDRTPSRVKVSCHRVPVSCPGIVSLYRVPARAASRLAVARRRP